MICIGHERPLLFPSVEQTSTWATPRGQLIGAEIPSRRSHYVIFSNVYIYIYIYPISIARDTTDAALRYYSCLYALRESQQAKAEETFDHAIGQDDERSGRLTLAPRISLHNVERPETHTVHKTNPDAILKVRHPNTLENTKQINNPYQ